MNINWHPWQAIQGFISFCTVSRLHTLSSLFAFHQAPNISFWQPETFKALSFQMQVSVLDLSLKCKTIAVAGKCRYKRLDLQRKSWKRFGFLSPPPSQAWPPLGATWHPVEKDLPRGGLRSFPAGAGTTCGLRGELDFPDTRQIPDLLTSEPV